MLHKCANPVCSAQFLYLPQGRLFEVEIQPFERFSIDGQGQFSPSEGTGCALLAMRFMRRPHRCAGWSRASGDNCVHDGEAVEKQQYPQFREQHQRVRVG